MSRTNRIALIIGGVILAILVALPFILGAVIRPWYGGWGWRMMGPGMMYGFGGGWFMMIFMIIFWGLIIWGIVALARHFGGPRYYRSEDNSALEILKRRYAQGEINREEFEEKKNALI